jgi:phenylacetic acid degradation operon negative regulatory protein
LERQRWLESNSSGPGERLYKLTATGRLHALGGRDPVERWTRRWDGHWRLVLFDVPVEHNSLRNKLRRILHSRGFGFFQRSVWVTPDPVEELRLTLAGATPDVGSLVIMEARPCAGETDEQIVAGAWDFADINRHYETYQEVLAQCPNGSRGNIEQLRGWCAQERQAWLAALEHDPLLPECLLPKGYLGRQVWQQRLKVMREAAESLRSVQVTRTIA